MSPELLSVLVLAVVFVIATTRSVNMGALAFAAAFGVGTLVADLDADGVFVTSPVTCSSSWSASPTCSPWPAPTAPPTGWCTRPYGRCGGGWP